MYFLFGVIIGISPLFFYFWISSLVKDIDKPETKEHKEQKGKAVFIDPITKEQKLKDAKNIEDLL